MPDDIFGVNKQLEKENEKLRKDVVRLAKRLSLEHKVTKGRVLDDSQLELAAKKILKEGNSTYDKKDLELELRRFYSEIMDATNPEELNWDSLMAKADDIAEKVLNKQKPYKVKDDYSKLILTDIRQARIKLSEEQIQEVKNAYGDDWRREFFGRITLTKDGRGLDSYWSEWAAQYPGVFDENVNPVNQILELSEIYDNMSKLKESEVYYRTLADRRALAIEIYNQFWNVPTVTTISDKYDKEIKRLKLQHREEMAQIKANHVSELQYVKETNSEQKLADSIYFGKRLNAQQKYYQDALKKLREEKNQKLADYKEYVKNKNLTEKEAKEKREVVNKITAVSKDLMDWMNKPEVKKGKAVPDALKPVVRQLLGAIDYSSRRALGQTGGSMVYIPTRKDVSLRKALENIRSMVTDSNTEEGMKELGMAIQFPPNYAEDLDSISKRANEIAAKFGEDNEYVLNEMSLDDLELLYQSVKTMKKVVKDLNVAIASANRFNIASKASNDIQKRKEYKESWRGLGKGIAKFFKWDNALPYYAFDHLGAGAKDMFTQIQDGWDTFAFHARDIENFAKETFNGEQRKKWAETVRDYTVLVLPTEAEEKRGVKAHEETISMTDAQVMSLYCLAKRDQAYGHMAKGGIRVATIESTSLKDKITKGEVVQTKNVRINRDSVDQIIKSLSKDQIQVADKLQNYMNTTCKDWMNEVTMKRWGLKGATEDNYFPIKVDRNVLSTEARENEKSIYKLLNADFTKPLTPNASNTIEINDIFEVFTNHASEMAKYNALALPVLDMIKYYNYTELDEDGTTELGTKKSIEQTYGKEALTYILNFLGDLNDNQETGRGEATIKKLTRGYKTAAVAANLQVALLQPVSIMRALNVINGKYIASSAALVNNWKKGMENARQYSGIQVWKDMSLFDTNLSRGLKDRIYQIKDTKSFEGYKDKAVDASMALAELGDKVTWGIIWNACEAEVRGEKHLSGEELKKETALRFREVIYRTQVVDSTMTRSDVMRSKSTATQWITSFMSEPTVGINVLTNAAFLYTRDAQAYGSKIAFKNHGRTILKAVEAYILSAALEGVVRGLSGKWRDWDGDDETVLQRMWSEFLDNLNVFKNIPILKDIISIFQGYSVERMDMAFAKSAYYAVQGWEKNGLTYKTVYRTLQAMSQFTGLPIANALREVEYIWNNIVGNMYPDLKIEK